MLQVHDGDKERKRTDNHRPREQDTIYASALVSFNRRSKGRQSKVALYLLAVLAQPQSDGLK